MEGVRSSAHPLNVPPAGLAMLNFERSSLNQKLTIISFLSTGTALLFVFIAFAVTSVLNHRKDEGMQLSSFAGVIGTNSVDALVFNDRNSAQNTLSALKAKEEISNATLFDRNGKVFARYVAAGRAEEVFDNVEPVGMGEEALAEANAQGSTFWSTRMRLYRHVTGNNHQVGIVMIEADLTNMWLDIFKSLGVIAAAMGGSLTGGAAAGEPLQEQHRRPGDQADQCGAESVGQPELHLAHRRTSAPTSWAR